MGCCLWQGNNQSWGCTLGSTRPKIATSARAATPRIRRSTWRAQIWGAVKAEHGDSGPGLCIAGQSPRVSMNFCGVDVYVLCRWVVIQTLEPLCSFPTNNDHCWLAEGSHHGQTLSYTSQGVRIVGDPGILMHRPPKWLAHHQLNMVDADLLMIWLNSINLDLRLLLAYSLLFMDDLWYHAWLLWYITVSCWSLSPYE